MSEEYNNNTGSEENDSEKKKKKSQEEFPIQEYRLVPADEVQGGYEEDEIDLIELAGTVWNNRKIIYKFVAAGIILGLLVALLSPEEFESSATLMPEYNTESQGGGASQLLERYGGLLGMSGGSYNSASNALRVDLYPHVVNSLTFQKNLMDQEFYFADYDTTASLYTYFTEIYSPSILSYVVPYTIGLPFTIKNAIFSNEEEENTGSNFVEDQSIVSISKEEMEVIEDLRERVTASLNEETGIVTVNVKMPDRIAASRIAKFTIQELTKYLTEYRIEKVTRDLQFIEEQLEKAEERFEEAQLALADFRDTNQGRLTARAETEDQRLNSEYDVAFNLYNSLTQQYEEARLKVQEETPIFKVLQPIQVPVEKSEPRRSLILIVFVLLSGILALGWIFIRRFWESHKDTEH